MRIVSSRGFTLIELLVVISLIGILSTIAMAYYNDYTAKSYNSSSRQLLRDLETAASGGIFWTTDACSGTLAGPAQDFRNDFPTCIDGIFTISMSKLAGSNSESGGYDSKSYYGDLMTGIGQAYNGALYEWTIEWDATSHTSGTQVLTAQHCKGNTRYTVDLEYGNSGTAGRDTTEGPTSFTGSCG